MNREDTKRRKRKDTRKEASGNGLGKALNAFFVS